MTKHDLDGSLELDGNAVAGQLAEIFSSEMTGQPVECCHCARVQYVGALKAYPRGPGLVLRCPSCETVLLLAVTTPRATCVDVRWIQAS